MFSKKPLSLSRLALAATVVALYWGFRSGRLIWTGSGFHLATYQVPAEAPTAAVHPEVLNLQASFNKVAELVKPAVVSITTTHVERVQQMPQFFFGDPFEQFFQQFQGPGGSPYGRPPGNPREGRKFKMEGMGSGVLIDPTGLVLTNEHVVHDADEIKVIVYDKEGEKTEYTGKVVGKDARTDIAVVRIRAGHKLPFAALGDSDKVQVGDWAIAIGSPFGLSQTFTVGVISAARQTLAIEDREYHNLIQTDAAINRGNSGGPLLSIRGEVVGINTAIYAPTGVFAGIGFAIPINQAKAILDQLVETGHVVRGWLGVELAHEISPAMVKAFGLPDAKGALVNSVMKDSPAEKAGLKRGDVIRTFDGKPVLSADKLQSMVTDTPPKKKVDVEILRERKTLKLSILIGERPESADNGEEPAATSPSKREKENEKTWHGARLRTLTPELAENFRQPADRAGVIVTDVETGSQAEEMGLAPGDIIRAVNQEPTPDLASFSRATSRVKLSEGVVLDILREGRPMYLSYTKQ
jgi:serine protease Do